MRPRAFTKEGLEWGVKRPPERVLKEWTARRFGEARSKHEAGVVTRRFMSFACTFTIACNPGGAARRAWPRFLVCFTARNGTQASLRANSGRPDRGHRLIIRRARGL
jgi:hypothetical protein